MGVETTFNLNNGTFYIKDPETGFVQEFGGIKNVEFDGNVATIEPIPEYLRVADPMSCTFTCENVKWKLRTLIKLFGFKFGVKYWVRQLFGKGQKK